MVSGLILFDDVLSLILLLMTTGDRRRHLLLVLLRLEIPLVSLPDSLQIQRNVRRRSLHVAHRSLSLNLSLVVMAVNMRQV